VCYPPPPPQNTDNKPLTIKDFFFAFAVAVIPLFGGVSPNGDGVVFSAFVVCLYLLLFETLNKNLNSHFCNSTANKDHPVQQAWQEALTDSRLSLTRAAYSPHSSPSIGGESRHNKNYLNDFLTIYISTIPKIIKAMFSFLGRYCFFIYKKGVAK